MKTTKYQTNKLRVPIQLLNYFINEPHYIENKRKKNDE